jgi:ankyrin repeat protein
MNRWRSISIGCAFSLLFSLYGKAGENIPDQETLNRNFRQSAILGNITHLKKLLDDGAEINSKAPYGESALDYTIRFGHHKATIRMLEWGADPNPEDDEGISPLYRAAGDCNASRVVEALLRAGANVNHRDLYGRTALMNAAHSDCFRNVAVILQQAKDQVDIDAHDDSLQTASDLARNGLVPQMLEIARNQCKKENKTSIQGKLSPLK